MATERWSSSDKLAFSLACGAGVMAIAFLWMEKTSGWAIFTVVAMALLVIYPVYHFCPNWRSRIPTLVVVWALVAWFGNGIWPRKAERFAPPPISTFPTPNVLFHSTPPLISDSQKKPPKRSTITTPRTAIPQAIQGNDNTVYGNVGNRTVVGSGNTIVGATDNNGNTIITQPVTVGNGACGSPGSIVIGAHAGNCGAGGDSTPKPPQ